MDPNANLREQLELVRDILQRADAGTYSDDDTRDQLVDAARLAELVYALDTWIESGGFLPKRWVITPDTRD
jgi:hypothetical protein